MPSPLTSPTLYCFASPYLYCRLEAVYDIVAEPVGVNPNLLTVPLGRGFGDRFGDSCCGDRCGGGGNGLAGCVASARSGQAGQSTQSETWGRVHIVGGFSSFCLGARAPFVSLRLPAAKICFSLLRAPELSRESRCHVISFLRPLPCHFSLSLFWWGERLTAKSNLLTW